jgi:microcystin-dependent protein
MENVVVVIGAGQGTGLPSYTLGSMGGGENTFMTADMLPQHAHFINVTLTPASSATANTNSPANAVYATSATTLYTFVPDTNLASFAAEIPIEPTGNSQLIPVLRPVLAMSYIICLAGLYPTPPND